MIKRPVILVVSSDTDLRVRTGAYLETERPGQVLDVSSLSDARDAVDAHRDELEAIFLVYDDLMTDFLETIDYMHRSNRLAQLIVIGDELPTDLRVAALQRGVFNIVETDLFKELLVLYLTQALEDRKCLMTSEILGATDEIDMMDRLAYFEDVKTLLADRAMPLTNEVISHFFPVDVDARDNISISRTLDAYLAEKGSGSGPATYTVLVVEDEPDMQAKLRTLLGRRRYKVLMAGSGADGLAMVTEREDIDLVLLDIGLPDQSGDELVPLMKAVRPQLPIMMLTAYGDNELVVACIRGGVSDYMQKPINKDVLFHKISHIMQRKALAQEVPKIWWDQVLVKLGLS